MVRSTRASRCGSGGGDCRVGRARVAGVAVVALVALVSTATVSSVAAAQETAGQDEVRIVARLLANEKVEFGLQQRQADDSWGDRRLPRVRFFPADASVGRWLSSSPITVKIAAADAAARDVEVRIVARLLANGKIEFGLQPRQADSSWGDRRLPRVRFFPTGARVGRWLSSSPLTVTGEHVVVAFLEVSGTTTLTSVGETAQLFATANMSDGSRRPVDDARVVWASSDVGVVSVAGGVITAVGGGNAIVTATYLNQSVDVPVSVHISTRETGTVRVLYASPADREFRSDYSEGIAHALVDLQSWYRHQLGGLTFSLYDVTPEYCQMGMPADFYVPNSWDKVVEGVQHCAPVEGYTSEFVWVVYADVGSECDDPYSVGRGGLGLTIVGRDDLEGLVGNRLSFYDECGRGPFDGPIRRWIGGIGHELGHALGLLHPPGCDDGLPSCDFGALMADGYGTYPDTYLRADEKEPLMRSLFIAAGAGSGLVPSAAVAESRVRGSVAGPDGSPVEGVRVSLVADAFWGWAETGPDGTFEVRLPAGSAGSAVVSVHAGETADCRWLGYHSPGGLTTVRDAATRVEVGRDEVASVQVALAAGPDGLCGAQGTLRGTVVESDGTPAQWLELEAFGEFRVVGEDGTFEIPLPENWPVPSILSIHDFDCGLIGYYSIGGFATRREDAARIEVGAADAVGIEVRLPQSRDDLCGSKELLTGTVLWPGGEPAEGIFLNAETFGAWAQAGPDGTFEFRLPAGSSPTLISMWADQVADCGWVGYHGPDGLTAQFDEAERVAVGTTVDITLPAGPEELCGWWATG